MTRMMTEREAAEMLGLRGIDDGRGRSWARTMGRRALQSGLAGAPVEISGTHWYPADTIEELIERPSVDLAHLASPADDAFLLLRARPHTGLRDWATLHNAGVIAAVELSIARRKHGFLPLVVTTCGFVVGGADVTASQRVEPTQVQLELRLPGPWFKDFWRRVLHTTAGNHWQLRYPSISPQTSTGWLGSR